MRKIKKYFLMYLLLVVATCAYSDNNPNAGYETTKYEGERFLRGEFQEDSDEYILEKGDVVKVLVREKPEFSGTFEIGPDGKIQFPFLGDIKAEGLVKVDLKAKVKKELETYIKYPELSVSIVKYRSKYVYILGEINKPGKYYMAGDSIALRDAVVQAGLPTRDASLKRTRVIKPAEVKPTSRRVNLNDVLYKGKLKDNLKLVSGDIVFVPSLVHSKINRFLNKILDPITRFALVDDLLDNNK